MHFRLAPGHFYERKWSLGSHGYCALGSYRGPFDPFEMPTIDAKNESIVATNAFFIDRADLTRSWDAPLKMRFLEGRTP